MKIYRILSQEAIIRSFFTFQNAVDCLVIVLHYFVIQFRAYEDSTI